MSRRNVNALLSEPCEGAHKARRAASGGDAHAHVNTKPRTWACCGRLPCTCFLNPPPRTPPRPPPRPPPRWCGVSPCPCFCALCVGAPPPDISYSCWRLRCERHDERRAVYTHGVRVLRVHERGRPRRAAPCESRRGWRRTLTCTGCGCKVVVGRRERHETSPLSSLAAAQPVTTAGVRGRRRVLRGVVVLRRRGTRAPRAAMDADVAAAAAAAADVLVASGSAAPDDERVPVAVQSAAGATPLASGAPEQLLARAAADAGDWCSDDGFEFGSDAASDSSSWSSSDEEEQGVPLAVGALPEWLARQGTAGGRCGVPCSLVSRRVPLAAHAGHACRDGSDVDDEEEDTCPRPPVATAPEVLRRAFVVRIHARTTDASCVCVCVPQELGPPLSSVDETEDIRAAGTVLSVVGCTVVVQACHCVLCCGACCMQFHCAHACRQLRAKSPWMMAPSYARQTACHSGWCVCAICTGGLAH